MKTIRFMLALLAAVAAARAAEVTHTELKLKSGEVLREARIVSRGSRTVSIRSGDSIYRVAYDDLPDEIREAHERSLAEEKASRANSEKAASQARAKQRAVDEAVETYLKSLREVRELHYIENDRYTISLHIRFADRECRTLAMAVHTTRKNDSGSGRSFMFSPGEMAEVVRMLTKFQEWDAVCVKEKIAAVEKDLGRIGDEEFIFSHTSGESYFTGGGIFLDRHQMADMATLLRGSPKLLEEFKVKAATVEKSVLLR